MEDDDIWAADVNRLQAQVARAYETARAEVFDLEGRDADPDSRTDRQKRLVAELAAVEGVLELRRHQP